MWPSASDFDRPHEMADTAARTGTRHTFISASVARLARSAKEARDTLPADEPGISSTWMSAFASGGFCPALRSGGRPSDLRGLAGLQERRAQDVLDEVPRDTLGQLADPGSILVAHRPGVGTAADVRGQSLGIGPVLEGSR
jgi:hypothetical protein